jgi:type I restriction enzyme S subunit
LIFVRNIRSSRFIGPDTRYVTEEKARELRAHKASGGDVLITKMGEPPGDACLYPDAMPDAIITADCIKWTLSLQLPDKKFFVHAINSELVKSEIRGITKGVAQLKVSLERFRGIAVPLPPLAEQQRIVAVVERRFSVVAEVEAAVAANLKRAERLRQAILKRAFEGKLAPQDPSDEPASVLLERIRREREVGKPRTRQMRMEL